MKGEGAEGGAEVVGFLGLAPVWWSLRRATRSLGDSR